MISPVDKGPHFILLAYRFHIALACNTPTSTRDSGQIRSGVVFSQDSRRRAPSVRFIPRLSRIVLCASFGPDGDIELRLVTMYSTLAGYRPRRTTRKRGLTHANPHPAIGIHTVSDAKRSGIHPHCTVFIVQA
jgi:hypothetical protein